VNSVTLNENLDRKTLSTRSEDLQNIISTVEVRIDKAPLCMCVPRIVVQLQIDNTIVVTVIVSDDVLS
jgi:site-specific recombinase